MNGEIPKISPAEWATARAQDAARIWDGRRYVLGLWPYRQCAEPVWCEVEVVHPLIKREIR